MNPAEHVSFEVLNDYVDQTLDVERVRAVEIHLSSCAACSRQLDDLRQVLSSVAALPRTVLPDEDLWYDLRESISQRKELVLPTAGSHTGGPQTAAFPRKSPWRQRGLLAAAAVILVTLSSGITALVLRSGPGSTNAGQVAENPPLIDLGAPPTLPASFRVAEGEYARTIGELRTAFDSQRSSLSPQTVRTVEHSLAVIDAAIEEARAALLSDPGNRTLVDLLSASYQRKLDLLRRTSELTSRI